MTIVARRKAGYLEAWEGWLVHHTRLPFNSIMGLLKAKLRVALLLHRCRAGHYIWIEASGCPWWSVSMKGSQWHFPCLAFFPLQNNIFTPWLLPQGHSCDKIRLRYKSLYKLHSLTFKWAPLSLLSRKRKWERGREHVFLFHTQGMSPAW